jgi:dipeptidyl aminopeptidase/acylaminoacyl peptidase
MSKHLVLVACLGFLSLASVRAEPAKAKTKWTEDDVVYSESVSDFRVSPDGKWVVWVKSSPDEDKTERVGHLFRAGLDGKKEVQLTRGPEACVHPRWSPDGKYLAFLSTRPGQKKKPKAARASKSDDDAKTQLWLMDASGGEPWVLTEGTRDVSDFAWAGAETLVFSAKEDPTLREKTLDDEKKDTSVVIEDEKTEPPVRLFKVDVNPGKVKRLTSNTDWIQSLAVSPDGKWAVTVHGRSLRFIYDNKIKPVVVLTNLATGERKQLFKERQFNLVHVDWTQDSKGFYAASLFTTHPQYVQATVTELYHYDLASAAVEKVDLAWERGLAQHSENNEREGIVPLPDGFLALLADGARTRAARYVRTGPKRWTREWLQGEHAAHLFGLEASRDGKTVLYAHSRASIPTRWYRARLKGAHLSKPKELVDINTDLREKPLAITEVMHWKGALDEVVEGILYHPHRSKPGQKYPLLVMIHGGPFGADFDGWEETWTYPANLYAQRGAFVLKPNYHGSSSYGLKFAESIAGGKYYEYPLIDIERGIESLVRRGLVDPNRVGTLGWSNGAILSAALITRNPHLKAASLGAGGAEWVADWGACEFGLSFSNYYLGKSPLEDPQLYIKMAPLYQFDRIRTPTILFQGDADRSVPPHHAWSQFRTLQTVGKVDVRLVMFPSEEHSLKKLVHQKRKLKEELAWFDRHLFCTKKEDDPALKRNSPLARVLKLKTVPRDGARYGVREKGVLVPETVTFEGLQVGRFEVTAAQYAQFDKSHKVERGKENYPATGVSFEQAQAYCRWLSAQTGRAYRLPDEEEAETLYDEGDGSGENTLDHWAGYRVNPEDAARLREKVRQLGGAALLREVGSFKGAGEEDMVFDLGGNAAEWVVTAGSKGRTAGGCAVLPTDSKVATRNPPPEYIGFRVVLDTTKEQKAP